MISDYRCVENLGEEEETDSDVGRRSPGRGRTPCLSGGQGSQWLTVLSDDAILANPLKSVH